MWGLATGHIAQQTTFGLDEGLGQRPAYQQQQRLHRKVRNGRRWVIRPLVLASGPGQ